MQKATRRELIELIHNISTSPANLPDLINTIPSCVNAKSSTLVVAERSIISGELLSQHSVCSDSLPSKHMATYNKEYIKYENTFGEMVLSSQPGALVTDKNFLDRKTIVKRPDVAFCIENLGVLDRCAIKLSDDAAWADILAFQFPATRGNITTTEFDNLKPIIPSLAQAISQMRMLDSIRKKFNAVFSVLNRIDISIMILDQRCRVILKNDCAAKLIDQNPDLGETRSGVFYTKNANENGVLQAATSKASMAAQGDDDFANQKIKIGSDLSQNNVVLEISPLRDTQSEIESKFYGALVIIIDPNRALHAPIDTLKLFYGLTNAEAEVASHICDGHSYDRIAESRNVGQETIKTQVSSLYKKIKTNSRAGLVRKILSISLPFVDDNRKDTT